MDGSSNVKEIHQCFHPTASLCCLLCLRLVEIFVLSSPVFSSEVALVAAASALRTVAKGVECDLEGVFQVQLLHDDLDFLN